MAKLVLLCASLLVATALAANVITDDGKVIYGVDNRHDQFDIVNADLLNLGDSSVALIKSSNLQLNGNVYDYNPTSFGTQQQLCTSERFFDQPAPAFCSGVLVGRNLIATAGHCIDSSTCGETRFVFGFVMNDPNTPVPNFPADEVYSCRNVIRSVATSTVDFAIIRLDRNVPNHSPVSVRQSGNAAVGTEMIVIGHPSGLPRKYTDSAFVFSTSNPDFFVMNSDTYGGNSGSPVFNINTLQLEGLLVRGATDFVPNGPCFISNVCPEVPGTPDCGGEETTKASVFRGEITSDNAAGSVVPSVVVGVFVYLVYALFVCF